MEIRIQSIHFDASHQLKELIEKKMNKLTLFCDEILAAEVTLKVVKPETNKNKEVGIKLVISGNDLFANKVNDSFEAALDEASEALQKQLLRYKEKVKK